MAGASAEAAADRCGSCSANAEAEDEKSEGCESGPHSFCLAEAVRTYIADGRAEISNAEASI